MAKAWGLFYMWDIHFGGKYRVWQRSLTAINSLLRRVTNPHLPTALDNTLLARGLLALLAYNRLPQDLTSAPSLNCFKARLQTHLFRSVLDYI